MDENFFSKLYDKFYTNKIILLLAAICIIVCCIIFLCTTKNPNSSRIEPINNINCLDNTLQNDKIYKVTSANGTQAGIDIFSTLINLGSSTNNMVDSINSLYSLFEIQSFTHETSNTKQLIIPKNAYYISASEDFNNNYSINNLNFDNTNKNLSIYMWKETYHNYIKIGEYIEIHCIFKYNNLAYQAILKGSGFGFSTEIYTYTILN